MLTAQIIGNIGGDPEMKYAASGTSTLRFNVASNYRARNQSGEWEDRTEWVRVMVFGKRADSLESLLKKGMRVYVAGRLEARPWTDQQGNVRAGLEVIASDVEFFSTKRDDAAPLVREGKPTPAAIEDLDGMSDLPF